MTGLLVNTDQEEAGAVMRSDDLTTNISPRGGGWADYKDGRKHGVLSYEGTMDHANSNPSYSDVSHSKSILPICPLNKPLFKYSVKSDFIYSS